MGADDEEEESEFESWRDGDDDDDDDEAGLEGGYGDDFRIGGGRSYCTGRGGSVEAREGGMNLNWWYQASGCGSLCARELKGRLMDLLEQGRLERAALEGEESESEEDEGDVSFFGVGVKRRAGAMDPDVAGGGRKRVAPSWSPGSMALFASLV